MNKIVDTSRLLPPFENLFNVDVVKKMVLRPEALDVARDIGIGENLNIFIGSSGAGRDTLLEECLIQMEDATRLRRTTTRNPREYVADQERMLFVTEDEFLHDFKRGKILFAGRYKANGKLYGISKSEILKLKSQKDTLFLLEENFSGLPLKVLFPKSKLIVVLPPTIGVLKERIFSRGEISEECQKRFNLSVSEIKAVLNNMKSMLAEKFVDMVVVNIGSPKEVAMEIIKARQLNERFVDDVLLLKHSMEK